MRGVWGDRKNPVNARRMDEASAPLEQRKNLRPLEA